MLSLTLGYLLPLFTLEIVDRRTVNFHQSSYKNVEQVPPMLCSSADGKGSFLGSEPAGCMHHVGLIGGCGALAPACSYSTEEYHAPSHLDICHISSLPSLPHHTTLVSAAIRHCHMIHGVTPPWPLSSVTLGATCSPSPSSTS